MAQRPGHDQRGEHRHGAADVVRGSRSERLDDRTTRRERDGEGDQCGGLHGPRHAAAYVVGGASLQQSLLGHAREAFADPFDHHQRQRDDPDGRPADREHDHATEQHGDQERSGFALGREPPGREHRAKRRASSPQRGDQAEPERTLSELVRVGQLRHEDQTDAEEQHRPAEEDRPQHRVAHRVPETGPDPGCSLFPDRLVVEPAGRRPDEPRGEEERCRVEAEHERAGCEQAFGRRAVAREQHDQLRPQQRPDEAARGAARSPPVRSPTGGPPPRRGSGSTRRPPPRPATRGPR